MIVTNLHLAKAIRGLIAVIEAGSVNSAQQRAIMEVRLVLGDIDHIPCAHEHAAYEEGDVLVCLDCRENLSQTTSLPQPETVRARSR